MSITDVLRSIYSVIARVFAFARVTLANILVVVVVVLIIAFLAVDTGRVEVEKDTALLLQPAGAIVDQIGGQDPLDLVGGGSLAQTKLGDILSAIEQASADDRIGALVLDTSSLGYVAPAQLEVIGDALEAFRASGKRLVAKSQYYGRDQYYLASFADTVIMHPFGEVMLNGYGRFRDYYAGLIDKLKVNVHVFRVGTYKSYVEPYTRNDMSEAAKRANLEMVDSLWSRYVERVGVNRGLEPAAVMAYADRYDELLQDAKGDTARLALEYGLVDQLLEREALDELLSELTGDADPWAHVAMQDYIDPVVPEVSGDTIAVIPASGPIMMGNQPRGAIGAATLSGLLEDARDDDSVAAVVLRIDSGGGSAFASELIRQSVLQVKEEDKPVVVSMGGTAASGGYWIASPADEIWAAPTTLTGSIGIFAMVPTFEATLDAVGVARDGVRTGPFVGALDPVGGVGEAMGRALQANVDFGYRRFIELVASGRDLPTEQVEAVAEGRVWLGERALEHGLVDNLGHLDDAVARAAELAGVEDYQVRILEKPLTNAERLARQLLDNVGLDFRTGRLGSLAEPMLRDLRLLNSLNDPRHIYALCEMCP